jgi:hypothetical protein
MPLRLRGRAERYGHSFNRNKAVIWRMSVDLSEYLVGQVLQSKRRQFGVLQKFYATARDEWRLAVAGEFAHAAHWPSSLHPPCRPTRAAL